jgi:hypothetical protein
MNKKDNKQNRSNLDRQRNITGNMNKETASERNNINRRWKITESTNKENSKQIEKE